MHVCSRFGRVCKEASLPALESRSDARKDGSLEVGGGGRKLAPTEVKIAVNPN